MSDAISHLLASRKFLLLVLDTLISLLTYFIGKYSTPATAQDLLTLIAALQPVFVAVILGIAHEDSAAKGAYITYEDITKVAEPDA